MQKRMVIVLLLALAVGMASAQTSKPAGKAAQGPAAGTWKLNVDKSDFGGMPALKSAKMVITSDTRDSLKWKVTEVGAGGKVRRESYSGAMDGKPYPIQGEEGVTLAYTPREDGAVEIDGQSKRGNFKETAMLSPDKNTLTVKGEANGPQGPVTWTQVYERVGGGAKKSTAKKESKGMESAKQ